MRLQSSELAAVVMGALFLIAAGCKGSGIDGGADCGNDLAEQGELCDGTDLAGQTCLSQGLAGGTLACDMDCGGFDTSGCAEADCGDGLAEGLEVCDGSDLRGESCVTMAFETGALGCQAGCTAYDISGCSDDVCGNDLVEGAEVCDGSDLGGADCVSEDFDYGALLCLGTCDGYDDTGCDNEPTCDTSDQCSDPDPTNCICEGCNTNGQCQGDDDCVCPDCHGDQQCSGQQQCTDDNVCDPYTEHCGCVDCASHSLCQ